MSIAFAPSTIDWCEANYTLSNIIAEPYNTFSGLFIAITAYILQQKLENTSLYKKYTSSFSNISFLLFITSLGTIFFHGSLLFLFQLLDEIPMLLIGLQYTYILKNIEYDMSLPEVKTYGILDFLPTIVSHAMFLIPFAYYIHSYAQIMLFHFLIKCIETVVVFKLYRLSKNINRWFFSRIFQLYGNCIPQLCTHVISGINAKKIIKTYTYIGLIVYITSMGIWVAENMFCEKLRQFQLHAIWHMLSSIGIFYLNMIMIKYVEIISISKKLE